VKKYFGVLLVLFILIYVSCGSGKKYNDIREFVNELVATQDAFLSQVDKSTTADEVVTAIDLFGQKLVALSGKSMEIRKKYPDVDKWVNNPPAELKADLDKINDTESKFEKVFLNEKNRVLIRDKKVQTAFIELNKKMESVKFFQ